MQTSPLRLEFTLRTGEKFSIACVIDCKEKSDQRLFISLLKASSVVDDGDLIVELD